MSKLNSTNSISLLLFSHRQECGAHREVHHLWNADPLQDYLRRQAFFYLYEMGYRTSYSLGRAPLVEYDDFDLRQ
jgi:hypothetical protein